MNDDRRRIQLKPYHPPVWSAAAVRFNNLLVNKTQAIAFPVADTKVMHFQLLPGAHAQQPLIYPISMTLGLGDSTAGLWLSDWPLVDHIRTFIPEGMLTRLPENLGIALTENALDPLLNIAEATLGVKIRVQSLSAELNNRLYTLPLTFELTERPLQDPRPDNTRLLSGLLVLEEKLYPLLQERMRLWPSDSNEAWQQLETETFLEIGASYVPIQDINNLAVSDVILVDETAFHTEGELRLRFSPHLYCHARLATEPNRNLTITTDWINMADQENKQNINQINQIPVQLSFDLGQKGLSFNEVKQLRPGYVIDLPQALPEVVQIRAQNKLIGTGELVDVSGRIGVRILSLFGTRSRTS